MANDELKKDGLQKAVSKARTQAQALPRYTYEVKAPDIMPRVYPKGITPPVLAQDSANDYAYINSMLPGTGFPGFAYLSQLATRGEFMNMASALATEITREWIEFNSVSAEQDEARNEKIKQIESEFKRLNVREVVRQAAIDDCYFGRGQIYIDIQNAKKDAPLIIDPRTN
jgi:hypothetical protein